MFGIGVPELLIILVLVLVFFGAEKIPQLAKSLGKGMAEFRKAQEEVKGELAKEVAVTATINSYPAKLTNMFCPGCNGQSVEGSLFCSQCGKQMSNQVSCNVCQRQLLPDEKFCPNCGQPGEVE